MAGIDGRTGKVIGTSDHIRQSIEVILTMPKGTRIMARSFGNEALSEDGKVRPDLSGNDVAWFAQDALVREEPRATFDVVIISRDYGGDRLLIRYTEKESGEARETIVVLPNLTNR